MWHLCGISTEAVSLETRGEKFLTVNATLRANPSGMCYLKKKLYSSMRWDSFPSGIAEGSSKLFKHIDKEMEESFPHLN